MSDIQLYLLEYDKNKKEATSIAERSASRLQDKQLKLLELIEGLGEYIASEDGGIRGKTMAYLAEVLACVPRGVLSVQQRNLLTSFILSRITDDTVGLGACAKGLLSLEQLGKWDNERVVEIMNTLLDHTHPLRQYKFQSERYPVLRLVDGLMARYRDALRNLHDSSPDFLGRFIAYFDGEKDPRNLMVVFSILKVPMTEWNIGADAQDLFDAVFNYFPITFRPPPDDPYGITAQDLKDRLRECIGSTADFAPYAFPALLDKLDSTTMNTKRDSLQTITHCVSEYGARTVALYHIPLWDSVKMEIFGSQEEDLTDEGLKALEAIARTLSKGESAPLTTYLRTITKECNEHLEDAPTKQSQASGQILRKVAATSSTANNFILNAVIPNIFTLYQTADTMAKRRGLIEVLIEIIQSNIEVYGDWRSIGSNGDQSAQNGLTQFSDQVLEVLVNGLSTAAVKEVSFRLVCVNALLQLSKVRQLLSDVEIGKIIQLLHSIVIHEQSYGKDEIKEAAINGLVEIAHQKPQVVVDNAFPAFMAELPDSDVGASTSYIPVLEAFAKLGSEEKIFDRVILRLKNKLNSAIAQEASSKYIVALLSAILYALTQGSSKLAQDTELSTYYNDLVIPLVEKVSSSDSSHQRAFENESTLDLVGRICNLIIRSLSLEDQNRASAQIYQILRSGAKPSPDHPKDTILSTHILASLRRETALPIETQDLLSSLIDFSQHADLTTYVRAASLRQISLLVNKYIPTPSLKSSLDPIFYPPTDLLNPELLDTSRIRIVFAILKALVLRNARLLEEIYPKLLELLGNPVHGKGIARGFTGLLLPDGLLTKQNYCTISGLHKQKTFALLVPRIVEGLQSAEKEVKGNYLVALSGVLRWVGWEVVSGDVGGLVGPLLMSLDAKGEEGDAVREGAITILAAVLRERAKEVEEHVSVLVSKLLNTAVVPTTTSSVNGSGGDGKKSVASPTVRKEALKCLALVPKVMRREMVVRLRRGVLRRLRGALGDPKRGVRSEAVRCVRQWELVEEDDGDDD